MTVSSGIIPISAQVGINNHAGGMDVLITGAGGFAARYLIDRLRSEGNLLLAGIDRVPGAPRDLSLDAYYCADVSDRNQLAAVVRETNPRWLFHLAGRFRGTPEELYRTNLLGTLNVLESVRAETPDCAVMLVGSAAEYGCWPASEMPIREDHACRPVGSYAVSKHAASLVGLDYARDAGLKVVIVRPFNLVGAGIPSTLVVGAIVERMRQALAGPDPAITIGNLSAERDFIAVEDAVDSFVRVIQAQRWGEVFNVCSEEPHSIDSVLRTLLSFCARPIRVVLDAGVFRPNDPPVVYGDAGKIRQAGCFDPRVSLQDSLRASWEMRRQIAPGNPAKVLS